MITDSALVEFVDETGECVSFGEPGEIVITGFSNHIMPLIRYRIGDSGTQTDRIGDCGRSWPLIKDIQGRLDDYLVLPSGRKISWLYLIRAIYDIFFRENVLAISQYQIVQERKDKVVLSLVRGREFKPEILRQIKWALKLEFSRLGEDLEIVTQIVDDIPRERTGKRRTLISKIN